MNRRTFAFTAILTLALSLSGSADCNDLRGLADTSKAAAGSKKIDQASGQMEGAWQGHFGVTATVTAPGEGRKKLPAYTLRPRNGALSPSPSPVNGRGEPTIAERRAEIKKGQTGVGDVFRAAAYGVAGFVAGVLFGWLAGAVAGGAFVMKAPNPGIQKWKWALLVPAVVAGAVVGAVVMPFLFGYIFSKAKPYPGKGLPDRRNID